MERNGLIYLDHAATTYPKPLTVRNEVIRCLRDYGGNPGRGAHALSMKAAEKVYECRERASSFFGVGDPERVLFTMNTTYALNLALKGTLREGDHVILSDLEHNAVWRPLYRMEQAGTITMDVLRSGAEIAAVTERTVCENLEKLLQKNTRLVACTHMSNICSAEMPIRKMAEICHKHGILFVVDGAQSAGHLPIRVDEWGIDALCVQGHKGLLGPQGCGMLLLGKGIAPETLMEGGNGLYSLDGAMTDQLPERYEVGTLPTLAIAGLCEGIKLLERVGIETCAAYER
ncbi:MAG: aminotransferase class V-fold PLP-dependent enzyme, partial [Clostridia bacterium]|nr:aminotransferase class V-fold PLP-dependent enzyme [Clostridia bacterium]